MPRMWDVSARVIVGDGIGCEDQGFEGGGGTEERPLGPTHPLGLSTSSYALGRR